MDFCFFCCCSIRGCAEVYVEYGLVATSADHRFWVFFAKTKELYRGLHTILTRRYLLSKCKEHRSLRLLLLLLKQLYGRLRTVFCSRYLLSENQIYGFCVFYYSFLRGRIHMYIQHYVVATPGEDRYCRPFASIKTLYRGLRTVLPS